MLPAAMRWSHSSLTNEKDEKVAGGGEEHAGEAELGIDVARDQRNWMTAMWRRATVVVVSIWELVHTHTHTHQCVCVCV